MNDETQQKRKFLKQALSLRIASPVEAEQLGVPRMPIHVPVLSPFHDWDFYYLRMPIAWRPELDYGDSFHAVEVQAGFVTDFASIPRIFWSILPPAERYTHAAIIHDYVYWTQDRERSEADKILKLGMKELGVNTVVLTSIYRAVRTFGWIAWNRNKRLQISGEKRILAKFPDNPLIGWQEWKNTPGVFAEH